MATPAATARPTATRASFFHSAPLSPASGATTSRFHNRSEYSCAYSA